MFKNKREVVLFIALAALAVFMTIGINDAFAGSTITLENGAVIPLDGLSDEDKKKMIVLTGKIAEEQAKLGTSGVVDTIKEVAGDPVALDQWRKFITGTIKDVASDLGFTVNEFVKTPVGMGVAALVFYKVAGKDFISATMDVVLAVPMWIIIMSALWYIQRQYLTTITIYDKIVEGVDEKGKKQVVKTNPKQAYRYKWNSNDARSTLAAFLYGSMIVITVVCIFIIFVF